MKEYVLFVGLDEPESDALRARLDVPSFASVTLPPIVVKDGVLLAEASAGRYVPVSALVYHAIYEDDLDFMVGLALWGGPTLPNARAMMDCRLKLPCLVRALEVSRFTAPRRGFASRKARYMADDERVAKWGNWHCGENKERFEGMWYAEEASVIEPFLRGQAVRVVCIGEQAWQIRLEGNSWLKSIHHADADFMPLDGELLEDTQAIGHAFGLEIVANDYIVGEDGQKHLLEVNHIPNVTRFPALWAAYADYAVRWVERVIAQRVL
jgi:hypothetical protein